MSYSNIPVVAFAVPHNDGNNIDFGNEHDNIYSNTYSKGDTDDDAIDRSASLFSQLDSMIASVQVESSQVESMKDRLKEMDSLKGQVGQLTQKLLNADQKNLQLKKAGLELQEHVGKLKRTKMDLETMIGPMRGDLEKHKEGYQKERMTRLKTQQDLSEANAKIVLMEKQIEDMTREVKTIPSLSESNEILKNDLNQIRQRYKEDRHSMQKTIQSLESQVQELESNRSEIRNITLRLIDTTGSTGNAPAQVNMLPIAGMSLHGGQQQQQQPFPQHFPQQQQHQSNTYQQHQFQPHQPPPMQFQPHQQHQSNMYQQQQQQFQQQSPFQLKAMYQQQHQQQYGDDNDLGLISGMASLATTQVKSPGHFPPAPRDDRSRLSHDDDGSDSDDYSSTDSRDSRSSLETDRTGTAYTPQGKGYESFNTGMDQSQLSNMSQDSIKSQFLEEGALGGGDNFIFGDDENAPNHSIDHSSNHSLNQSLSMESVGSNSSPYERLKKKQQASYKKKKQSKQQQPTNEQILDGMGMTTPNNSRRKKKKTVARLPKLH